MGGTIMRQAMMDYFTKSFDFKGRATRKDFWIPNILYGVLGIGLSNLKAPDRIQNALTVIFTVPALSLTSRRYQDAGISGWLQLPQLLSILLLPLVFMSFVKRWMKAAAITVIVLSSIAGFILTLLPSDGDNKYGKRP